MKKDAAVAKKPVTLIAVVTALCLLGDSMLYVVLPIFWREAGLTALWQVGVLLSVNRFVRLPLNPLIGWLYNRMPLRAGLIAAVFLGALTTAGYGLCRGFAAWLVLRAVWGVAWSLLRMGGYLTVIAYSDDSNRGHWMGAFNGIYRIGSLAGMLLGGLLVPVLGLPPVAIAFGAVALASLPAIAVFMPKGDAERRPAASAASLAALRENAWHRSSAVRKAVATGLAIAMLQSVPTATLSLVIEANYAGGLVLLGYALGGTALAGVLQAVRWTCEPLLAARFGRLSDGPRGRLPLFAGSLVAAAVGFALMPWPLPPAAWLAAVLVVMVSGTAVTTLMDAVASDAARTSSVVAVMTAYSVATDLGSAIGPAVSYALAGWTGGLVSAYAGCAVLFAAIAVWYRPRRRAGGDIDAPGAAV
ncbi:MFS transporter [Paenibacillus flagellatus]|uniref:MFS transporter n=1 Tax=Paenibacillus flagellatus TaxID=2211139 RepID=A0A2V5KEA9_9BACL|nr:MFS transporter [Paenibacillus flagellatus]PYI56413.1 MFS transporter [Paenibacillus flagellatus]